MECVFRREQITNMIQEAVLDIFSDHKELPVELYVKAFIDGIVVFGEALQELSTVERDHLALYVGRTLHEALQTDQIESYTSSSITHFVDALCLVFIPGEGITKTQLFARALRRYGIVSFNVDETRISIKELRLYNVVLDTKAFVNAQEV